MWPYRNINSKRQIMRILTIERRLFGNFYALVYGAITWRINIGFRPLLFICESSQDLCEGFHG